MHLNWIEEMLSSGSKISSKRVITTFAFLLMSVAFIIDLFTNFTISENLFSSMEYIVIAGLGFTATERFSVISKKEPVEPSKELLNG